MEDKNARRHSIANEQSLSKALLVFGACLVVAFLCFVLLSLLSFVLIHWLVYGNEETGSHLFEHNTLVVMQTPISFLGFYKSWWQALISNFASTEVELALFIPLMVPPVTIFSLFFVFSKTSYSFTLWYVLSHHFAKLKDVQKMGLFDGQLMVLGRFGKELLGIKKHAAVLCLGETGCGKTSTVAVPSILRSDNMSVVVVDDSGALARYTSGYRASLGPVFYFNWDVIDNIDKKEVYPRWNPLSVENIPSDREKKEEYIKLLSSFMISADGHVDKDNYWDWLASGALSTFIAFVDAKCKQAVANDYFLSKILENGRLSKDDKDILLSYYALMPNEYKTKAIKDIEADKLTTDDYFPIGSWGGIPASWQGKDVCCAMITDWLLQNYLTAKDEKGDWRQWLESLILEATLFGYGASIIRGLQQFLYLSKQQRQLVFAYVLKPLRIFINQVVRERTSGNDIKINDLRNYRDITTNRAVPITIYVSAKTKTTKFISRMFVEVLLQYGVLGKCNETSLPMLVVMDDAGQMLKVRGLAEAVAKASYNNTSFLLLCNSFNNMENTYGREILEDLISNTSYKIIMAENCTKFSRQLNKMAIFATKSVQIPLDKKRIFSAKPHFADANYFHRLAQELQFKGNVKIETKGYQILLVEGYYHRPVLTRNTTFMKDDLFRDKANISVSYFLADEISAQRNIQDIAVPKIDEVLYDVDLGIDDEIELDQYMNVVYNDVKSKVPEDTKIESVMVNDISEKWKRKGGISETFDKDDEGWWMDEYAFAGEQDKGGENPFALKNKNNL